MPFVFVLLLYEPPLPVDEDLELLAQLEHLHAPACQAGGLGGLAELVDPLGEDSVLYRDGVHTLLQYQRGLVTSLTLPCGASDSFDKNRIKLIKILRIFLTFCMNNINLHANNKF